MSTRALEAPVPATAVSTMASEACGTDFHPERVVNGPAERPHSSHHEQRDQRDEQSVSQEVLPLFAPRELAYCCNRVLHVQCSRIRSQNGRERRPLPPTPET